MNIFVRTQWNDPKWPEMWFANRGYENSTGFALDMNVEEAWAAGASGKGVVVTILDDGVEKFHPDLRTNYDEEASIDLNDNDRDPSPRYDLVNSNKHGTRCAGQVSHFFLRTYHKRIELKQNIARPLANSNNF